MNLMLLRPSRSFRRLSALLMMCATVACGGEVEDVASRTHGAASPEARTPGWYDVPAEPAARFYGDVDGELQNGELLGQIRAEGLPSDQQMYLAMKWGDETPIAVTELLPAANGVAFRAVLGCRADRSEGALLAYLAPKGAVVPNPSSDELLAISAKPAHLFGYLQRAYDQKYTWEMCQSPKAQVLPLPLQRDPRLSLAFCTEPVREGRACGQPVMDRTRLLEVSSEAGPSMVSIAPQFVLQPDEGDVTVTVNGVLVSSEKGRVAIDKGLGPFHPGENTVRIAVGPLPPWEAKLVLPKGNLAPRLRETALRMGEPFTVDWAANSWADRFVVKLLPLDVPVKRVSEPSYLSDNSFLTEVFRGFDDGYGGMRTAPRATLKLTAMTDVPKPEGGVHNAGGTWFRWVETTTVTVQPFQP